MALYFYGLVLNICLWKEKNRYPREITQAALEVCSLLRDLTQSYFFSETLIDSFGIFEKLLFLWLPSRKLLRCTVGIVSGRRALCGPAALGHSQHHLGSHLRWGGTSIPQSAAAFPPSQRKNWPKAGRVRKQGKLRRHSPSKGRGQGWASDGSSSPGSAWKASRAEGRCRGKGLYLLLVLPPRKYIGNAPLGSLDKHTLASSELHRV